MLNVLGRRNRDELRKEWDKEGFHPAEAYAQFCAQCHGDYLQGNGPVSPWIYPLPKNLNNVAFMRSLTKERLIYSLTHGVSGTPMPPWGETGKDKPDYDGIPVMNADEIEQLADWLYSFLPGQEIYKDAVPKWKYGPKDVMEELRREKSELPKNPSLSSYFPSGKGYTAALKPVQTREYDTVFDTTDNPAGGPDRNYYYIKKEYYTPENIAAGQAFFWENCAACHGKDADGAGLRAEAMYDAKPRMLINLDWINSKDDLRLLRSIKFGVPGTSMTAWGDLTTSKQRLQLVIFIRSLTLDNNLRSQFMSAIYQAFDRTDQTVESVSVKLSEKIDALERNYEKLKEERKLLEISGTQNEIVAAYKNEVEAKVKLSQAQKEYADFSALLKSLNAEKEVYTALGQQILIQKNPEPLMENYLSFLKLLDNKIALKEGKLVFQENKNDQEKMKLEEKKILDQIDSQLKEVKEKKIEMEKSPAEVKRLTDIINTLEKLRAKAISTFAQAETARNEQKKTLPDIKL
jgi:mono/diheme cytochrome c family protein